MLGGRWLPASEEILTMAKKKLVTVPKKEWEALVAFLRSEEKILKDSYNTPGKNNWEEFYKENHPRAYEIYDAARRAASRTFGK